MSDHDAVVFSFSIKHVPDQQNSFLQQDPNSMNVEVMWNDFKEAVYNTIFKHVPQRAIRSNSGLPWTNKEKKDMKVRKRLYDIAKRSNSKGD